MSKGQALVPALSLPWLKLIFSPTVDQQGFGWSRMADAGLISVSQMVALMQLVLNVWQMES